MRNRILRARQFQDCTDSYFAQNIYIRENLKTLIHLAFRDWSQCDLETASQMSWIFMWVKQRLSTTNSNYFATQSMRNTTWHIVVRTLRHRET